MTTGTKWYNNHLFWGTVGSAVVTAADSHLHLGIPQSVGVVTTIGLGIGWAAFTILEMLAKHYTLAKTIETGLSRAGVAAEDALTGKKNG